MCILEGARSKAGGLRAMPWTFPFYLSKKKASLITYSGPTAIVGPNRWHRNWHRTGRTRLGLRSDCIMLHGHNVTWGGYISPKNR